MGQLERSLRGRLHGGAASHQVRPSPVAPLSEEDEDEEWRPEHILLLRSRGIEKAEERNGNDHQVDHVLGKV